MCTEGTSERSFSRDSPTPLSALQDSFASFNYRVSQGVILSPPFPRTGLKNIVEVLKLFLIQQVDITNLFASISWVESMSIWQEISPYWLPVTTAVKRKKVSSFDLAELDTATISTGVGHFCADGAAGKPNSFSMRLCNLETSLFPLPP